jgi:hypothetical protein
VNESLSFRYRESSLSPAFGTAEQWAGGCNPRKTTIPKPMNIMNIHLPVYRTCRSICAAAVFSLLWLPVSPALAQDLNQVRNMMGSRIEAATILGGDFGMSGATLNGTKNDGASLSISKFGGAGDIGDPMPVWNTGIGWQPRLQGSMGYLTAANRFGSSNPDLAGAKSTFDSFAIQFGGGGRFWFNENFSMAPTFMVMYGHTFNNFFIRNNHNPLLPAAADAARKDGLIDWYADTFTYRPAMNLQYVYTWKRTIFTLSSDPTYFHTEKIHSSSSSVDVGGDSDTWMNKLDVDVPLGKSLFGHELRTGGYFSRTELMGKIKQGVGNNDHIYELHGRLVMDYLNELWKVQWIGIGYSYLWGRTFDGYSIGLDVAFQF